jgi:hypothetical protein
LDGKTIFGSRRDGILRRKMRYGREGVQLSDGGVGLVEVEVCEGGFAGAAVEAAAGELEC